MERTRAAIELIAAVGVVALLVAAPQVVTAQDTTPNAELDQNAERPTPPAQSRANPEEPGADGALELEEETPLACGACTQLGTLPPTDGTGKPWWEWIRMKTGETFGGDFHGMHNGTLDFRSDEVGNLSLNWLSVWEFYSPDPVMVVMTDHSSHVGPAQMTDNETLTIHTAGGDVTVRKSDVLTINAGGGDELSKWYLKLSVGLNIANATVNQFSLSTLTRVSRDDEYTRLTLNHDLSIGTTRDAMGVESTISNNQWGLAKFDYFVSQLFYMTLASVNVGYDILQNVGLRVTPGAGVGLHILDGGPDFDVELSGAYQYTRFDSVMIGADNDTNGGGGGYRLYFDWDPVPGSLGVTFEHRGFIIYSDEAAATNSWGQSTFRTSLIIDIDLGTIFDLDITGTYDRVLEPRPLADGSIPQADTWTLVVGLGFELGN